MKADLFIKKETFEISNQEKFKLGISKFLELGREIKELGDDYWVDTTTFYNFQTPHGLISDILWNNQEPQLLEKDIKRAFQLFIDRGKNFNDLKKDHKEIEYLRYSLKKDHVGFIGISFENCSINPEYEINNKQDLLKFHRRYLAENPPEKDNFRRTVHKYFPNIYLHKDIVQTLNGLQPNYKKIFKTIIFHLEIINDRFLKRFKENQNLGTSKVCNLLNSEIDTRLIEISRDQIEIDELEYSFINENKDEIKLNCHYHTKFKRYLESGIGEHTGNRIYFCSPQRNFYSEKKIPVGRIGKHRR